MAEEIYNFKVPRAEAEFRDDGLRVRLYYPPREQLEEIPGRAPEQLDFGIGVFEQLLASGMAIAADQTHPLRPSSAGSLYLFDDDVICCHRRDRGAGVHRLYHSPSGGFANSREFTYSLEGLEAIALRESAEECLLITRDEKPWLIVPDDSKDYTIRSAKRLGINLDLRIVKPEIIPSSDTLEVYEDDKELFIARNVCVSLLYESATSLTTLLLRKLPLSSEEVVAVDAEGIEKAEKFIHFNREAYFIPLKEINNKRFGTPLFDFRVSQLGSVLDGRPFVRQPRDEKPYLGPEGVTSSYQHLWAPEDMMVACLAGLGLEGYRGRNRLELELEKTRARKDKRSLVPSEYLIQ